MLYGICPLNDSNYMDVAQHLSKLYPYQAGLG